jgi:polysaccharide deacetylase 2 family uncharacterized protein YibQ
MERRDFLFKSAYFLLGSVFGLNGFSNAYASGNQNGGCFSGATISLIIDDIGFSCRRARDFLNLNVPLTFSILPRLNKSYDLALEIHERGHEVMLHQPMEPTDPTIDPGPGALYVGHEANKIAEIMEENIFGLPYITGVNNHMGSKFTESRNKIKEFLGIIKETGFFFVDSLTTTRSKAYQTAKRLQIGTVRRNVFLDNRQKESAVLYQLSRLKAIASKHGCAIGIGHPFPETVRAIGRFVKDLEGSGISLVHASNLICPT